MDVVDSVTRSRMMAGIRGRDTAPETSVRRYLHAAGLRFKLNDKSLQGRPDIVLPKYRVAIFVHGCFWHRHPGCKFAAVPSTRADFWASKFAGNIERDVRNVQALKGTGWTVLTVWECEVREELALDRLFWKIAASSR